MTRPNERSPGGDTRAPNTQENQTSQASIAANAPSATREAPGTALSTRAVASTLGCSASTISRDADKKFRYVVTGLDGKIYQNFSAVDRLLIAAKVHELRCQDDLTIRAIRESLLDRGLRVAVGTISGYLDRYQCSACSRVPTATPEQQVSAADDTR